MAKSINSIILLGTLTRDPETRTTSSGKTIVTFTLAVDRQGEGADFIDVTCWEKLGDLVAQYLAKGRRAVVQGRLRQESWDDKDTGKKRSRIEVVASDVTFLNDGQEQRTQDVVPDEIEDKPIDLSEIPFR